MSKKTKGKSTTKILLVVALIVIVAIGVVSWHDGLFGLTSISDINGGLVAVGTSVAVKGEITARIGNLVTVQDGANILGFTWTGASTLNSIVVVRGIVSSILTLSDVTSVDIVWTFTAY
jgi:hypothetical protein